MLFIIIFIAAIITFITSTLASNAYDSNNRGSVNLPRKNNAKKQRKLRKKEDDDEFTREELDYWYINHYDNDNEDDLYDEIHKHDGLFSDDNDK